MSGLQPNNDFLNDTSKNTEAKKRRTRLEIEMEKFPEYYALTEYHRKCLVANNYWRVMNGQPIIEVPPSDTHYYKYFDKKCYERVEDYKTLKNRGKQDNTNSNTEIPVIDKKEVVDSPQIINKEVKKEKEVKKIEPKIESKPEPKSIPKPKINPDTKCDFDIEDNTSVAVVESKKIQKPVDNDEPQLSLF